MQNHIYLHSIYIKKIFHENRFYVKKSKKKKHINDNETYNYKKNVQFKRIPKNGLKRNPNWNLPKKGFGQSHLSFKSQFQNVSKFNS